MRLLSLLTVVVLPLTGWLVWTVFLNPSARTQRDLKSARLAKAAGDFETAERMGASVLARHPESEEAALLAAESAAASNRFEQAVEYLNQFHPQKSESLIRVVLLKAEWSFEKLHRLSQAEEAYRQVLEHDPENFAANTSLSQLLGICGRRREAIPHILRLIRQNQDTDLLVLLSREGSVINHSELLEDALLQDPEDPLPLLGLAWHAASDENHDRSIQLLRQALQIDPNNLAVHIKLGQELLETRQFEKLIEWNQHLPSADSEAAEIWIVRGAMAEHADDLQGEIRCYWEAAKISPELIVPNTRLAKLLAAEGLTEEATRFATHFEHLLAIRSALDRMLGSSNHSTIEPALALAEACRRGGRLWEAYAWCRIAVSVEPQDSSARELMRSLREQVRTLPLQVTSDASNVALSIDLSHFPLPKFDMPDESIGPTIERSEKLISFRDETASTGLRFLYFNGTVGEPTRRMYEYTGGGIGSLDYDRDGWPDLYFTQGRLWPPESNYEGEGDRMFRNRFGNLFDDVSSAAGFREDDFGQGLAVGDFDADGFSDLFVGNLGRNRLWRNNGDGTFTEVTEQSGIEGNEWTTSCLFADLDGDGLSDIYAVNYLMGDDVFEKICRHPRGGPVACTPQNFDGQPDRLWKNDGNGRFSDATDSLLSTQPNGKGLGVVAWDADSSGRLSLFVSNDTSPNMFFVPLTDQSGKFQLTEQAILSGIAVNRDGKAEGCMGIALGDVNQDGLLDVHITNFLQESNTLYTTSSNLLFEDQTHEYGLQQPTLNLLGFGTQFLDADLDGTEELFVTNGHVDDLRAYDRPYRMRPQLFERVGDRFEEVLTERLGPYFQSALLGRAAVKLDWNRDGREDLVIGHLDTESTLLTNTTPESGAFLQLRLSGVTSNRDAVGTTVVVRAGDESWTRQITAGESYQSSNQSLLTFGLGSLDRIDELHVRWPSGTEQRFTEVPLSRELMLVEGNGLFSVENVE